MNYKPIENEVYHIHTYRCGHASNELDYEYVEAAIELGVKRISFTDHAPFPDNPFHSRMTFDKLPEYIESINNLKLKYQNEIDVLCGLEIEFLPSYIDYYHKLRNMDGLDILMIGQHFYEKEPGVVSYNDTDKRFEYVGQCKAMAQAVRTGLFDVIGHPDRSFRASIIMGENEKAAANELIEAVLLCVPTKRPVLEKNITSMQEDRFYKEEFWQMVPGEIETTYGLDAHSVKELIDGWKYITCSFKE